MCRVYRRILEFRCQLDVPKLVDHVAFGMPAFVFLIAVDFHKLLENCVGTANAFCRKSRRIVKVAICTANQAISNGKSES